MRWPPSPNGNVRFKGERPNGEFKLWMLLSLVDREVCPSEIGDLMAIWAVMEAGNKSGCGEGMSSCLASVDVAGGGGGSVGKVFREDAR